MNGYGRVIDQIETSIGFFDKNVLNGKGIKFQKDEYGSIIQGLFVNNMKILDENKMKIDSFVTN